MKRLQDLRVPEPPSQETLDAQWLRLGVGHEQIFPRRDWTRRELDIPNAGA